MSIRVWLRTAGQHPLAAWARGEDKREPRLVWGEGILTSSSGQRELLRVLAGHSWLSLELVLGPGRQQGSHGAIQVQENELQ